MTQITDIVAIGINIDISIVNCLLRYILVIDELLSRIRNLLLNTYMSNEIYCVIYTMITYPLCIYENLPMPSLSHRLHHHKKWILLNNKYHHRIYSSLQLPTIKKQKR